MIEVKLIKEVERVNKVIDLYESSKLYSVYFKVAVILFSVLQSVILYHFNNDFQLSLDVTVLTLFITFSIAKMPLVTDAYLANNYDPPYKDNEKVVYTYINEDSLEIYKVRKWSLKVYVILNIISLLVTSLYAYNY